jgi:flavin-dependent dehydrogenase
LNGSRASLPDNGHVVIIGGGPGGSACALALHRLSKQSGCNIRITVLEGKQFSGERNYNQCAGVLSPPLPSLLEDHLDVGFPKHLCQVEIDGYVLHSDGEHIALKGDEETSYAVRRVQFDAYMLDQVLQRGIEVIPSRAEDIEFHADHVVVYADSTSLEAEVVVGAFGLDEGSASIFTRATSYQPPQSLASVVTKYNPGADCMDSFGAQIHAFLPRNSRIEFGAITPKCDHLTINIAGLSVDAPLMRMFLEEPALRKSLPNPDRLGSCDDEGMCLFKGRFPRSIARGYYGDRYVMVGDAAGLVRAFKGKGATTAVLTGIRAAESIMRHGISAKAFHDHYRTANKDIIQDLPYGRGMRLFTISLSRFGLFDVVIRAAAQTPTLQSALFDAVSGHGQYKDILRNSLHPKSIQSILGEMFKFKRENL